jgi:hypothetical protein
VSYGIIAVTCCACLKNARDARAPLENEGRVRSVNETERNLLRIALFLIAVAGGFLLSLVGMYHRSSGQHEFSGAGAVLSPLGLRVVTKRSR